MLSTMMMRSMLANGKNENEFRSFSDGDHLYNMMIVSENRSNGSCKQFTDC